MRRMRDGARREAKAYRKYRESSEVNLSRMLYHRGAGYLIKNSLS